MNAKFHLAFKVTDIENTIRFYHSILGCELGRQTAQWIDFNFFGHQLSAHVSDSINELDYCGTVAGIKVPIPHFGCIVDRVTFNEIRDRLEKNKVAFVIKPQKRFEKKIGEHQTMFILDFSNNPLEFKCFEKNEEIFK